LSRFQFLRRFKHTVGMTPHAWLVRLRLERACTLLARSETSIAQVAMAVGFYDQSHFNRAFRSAFGVAPSGY
jgi:AraC-like DNA-binding protein